MKKPRLFWTFIYMALIPLVNWSFAHAPIVVLPDGGQWAPMGVLTGLVLVFRDFAQREIHYYILIPLIIGIVVSYNMAGPDIAFASGLAFGASELVDWAVYTFANRPLSERVMLSSLMSAPVDTMLFLIVANIAVPGLLTAMTAASSIATKLLAASFFYWLLKRKERKGPDLGSWFAQS